MMEAPFTAAIEAIRERRRCLALPGALDALRAERERRTVRWQTYTGGESLHRPEPLHAEREGAAPGRWLESGTEPPPDAIRCGFDSQGRIVLARSVRDSGQAIDHLLTHGVAGVELVIAGHDDAGDTLIEVLQIRCDTRGRVTTVRDQDGAVETYAYDETGRLTSVLTTFERDPAATTETTCAYDEHGALRRVVRAGDKAWDVWIAEWDTPEDVLPQFRELLHDVAPELAQATAAAIEAASEEVDEPRFALVRKMPERFPWHGVLVGARFLAGASMVLRGEELLDAAFAASADHGRGLCKLDLMAAAEPALQQRMRRVRQRLARAPELDRTERRAEREEWMTLNSESCMHTLGLLNGPDGLARIPVVLWESRGGAARWEPTIETAGRAIAEQIKAQLDSDELAVPVAAPSTRDELRSVACAIGLARVAEGVAQDARVAAALVPTTADASSCIGGTAPLPSGTAWPTAEGRPLTLLASIDCAAIPADIDDRDLLPADGLLVLFADLGNASSDAACVLHVSPETPTTSPAGSAGAQPSALAVRPTPRLTLRELRSACERFGLDPGEEVAYRHLLELVSQPPENAPAQLLGHPQPFQDDPREEHQQLLFGLHSDDGVTYLLAGASDLAARRWDSVTTAREWS